MHNFKQFTISKFLFCALPILSKRHGNWKYVRCFILRTELKSTFTNFQLVPILKLCMCILVMQTKFLNGDGTCSTVPCLRWEPQTKLLKSQSQVDRKVCSNLQTIINFLKDFLYYYHSSYLPCDHEEWVIKVLPNYSIFFLS